MRKIFTDPSSEGYVFQPKYHKRIPADGISQYMGTIWVSSAGWRFGARCVAAR